MPFFRWNVTHHDRLGNEQMHLSNNTLNESHATETWMQQSTICSLMNCLVWFYTWTNMSSSVTFEITLSVRINFSASSPHPTSMSASHPCAPGQYFCMTLYHYVLAKNIITLPFVTCACSNCNQSDQIKKWLHNHIIFSIVKNKVFLEGESRHLPSGTTFTSYNQ